MNKTHVVDVTPNELKTPEGLERYKKAKQTKDDCWDELAKLACKIAKLVQQGRSITRSVKDELLNAVKNHDSAYEEFCRAIAGSPSMEVKTK